MVIRQANPIGEQKTNVSFPVVSASQPPQRSSWTPEATRWCPSPANYNNCPWDRSGAITDCAAPARKASAERKGRSDYQI